MSNGKLESSNIEYLFSPKEQLVANLVVKGLSNAQVGTKLNLTETGVKFHVTNLLKKTNTSSRALFIVYYFEQALESAKDKGFGYQQALIKSKVDFKALQEHCRALQALLDKQDAEIKYLRALCGGASLAKGVVT